MFTDWLRHLRQNSLCQPQRIRKARRGRGSAGISTAVVQTLEPRVLLANPAGAEFQVNTYTTSFQRTNVSASSVAIDTDGDFVVTWSSFGQDGSGYGIFAQRYDAAGVAQGGEFQVNTYTTSSQQQSAVAMDADGDFVIAWSSGSQDGSGYGIYAQRYNAAGVAQGSEFRVNTFTTSSQRSASVAMDAAGNFAVIWSSNGQDGSGYGVYGQRYNAAGVAQGSEFRVNTYTGGTQNVPTIAMDLTGDFVVTWTSYQQDGSSTGVYAQRYNAAGVAQGSEFRVNTFTSSVQRFSTVAIDDDGDFVISWSSYGQEGGGSYSYGNGYGVFAQRYNAAGVAQGSEFRVNNYTTDTQRLSTVAMDSDGDFVVTWSSYYQDGDSVGIFAQQYSATGVRQGGEFQVNTYTTEFQRLSTVAMDAAGEYVVTWSSYSQDGSGYGVYAQRYDVNSGFNVPPTVNPQTFAVAENRPTGFVVGTVVASDPDAGQSLTYALVGGNVNNNFALNATTGVLTVNNPTINFETLPQYSLIVEVTDNGNPTLTTQATVTVNVTNVNEAPTISLVNKVASLSEAANTAVPIRVADIVIQDDGLGTNVVTLTGADAIYFQISGNQLQLKAGVPLDFETKPTLNVSVQIDDAAIGGNPDSTASLALKITNANEPPAVDLTNTLASILENVNTTSPISVATIKLTDDALGLETLSLSGDDAGLFEIVGSLLRIKAGAVIDYESSDTVLKVTVNVDDATIGPSPDDTADLEIQVIDVNEAPTLVVQPVTPTLPENASMTADRTVANVYVNDDALGTNSLTLSGFDAFSFKLTGNQLQLKAGVKLDFETKPSLSVSIVLNDPTVGATPDASFNFRLNVTDVNEAPAIAPRTFAIPAKASRGALVGTVTATDQDTGQFITYSIVGGNTDGAFVINSSTGQISVSNARAVRQPRTFGLTVRATDSGAPAAFGQAVMTISVGNARVAQPVTTTTKPAQPKATGSSVTQVTPAKPTVATTQAKSDKDQALVTTTPPKTTLLSRVLTAIKPKTTAK